MKQAARMNDKFNVGGVLTAQAVMPAESYSPEMFTGLTAKRLPGVNLARRALGLPLHRTVRYTDTWRGRERELVRIEGEKHNAFVNTGLQNNLDLWAGLGGTAVSHLGVTEDTTAVTLTTTKLDPTDDDTVTTVPVSNVSRTDQTVSFDGVYDENSLAHSVKKVGLLNTSTDAGTGLQNVIGGGGTAPFDETLTIDLTGASEFDLTMGIDVTAQST